MDVIDLDDQIRIMAAIIAAGLLTDQDAHVPTELATEAVDIATAIHNEVAKYEWKFNHSRTPKTPTWKAVPERDE